MPIARKITDDVIADFNLSQGSKYGYLKLWGEGEVNPSINLTVFKPQNTIGSGQTLTIEISTSKDFSLTDFDWTPPTNVTVSSGTKTGKGTYTFDITNNSSVTNGNSISVDLQVGNTQFGFQFESITFTVDTEGPSITCNQNTAGVDDLEEFTLELSGTYDDNLSLMKEMTVWYEYDQDGTRRGESQVTMNDDGTWTAQITFTEPRDNVFISVRGKDVANNTTVLSGFKEYRILGPNATISIVLGAQPNDANWYNEEIPWAVKTNSQYFTIEYKTWKQSESEPVSWTTYNENYILGGNNPEPTVGGDNYSISSTGIWNIRVRAVSQVDSNNADYDIRIVQVDLEDPTWTTPTLNELSGFGAVKFDWNNENIDSFSGDEVIIVKYAQTNDYSNAKTVSVVDADADMFQHNDLSQGTYYFFINVKSIAGNEAENIVSTGALDVLDLTPSNLREELTVIEDGVDGSHYQFKYGLSHRIDTIEVMTDPTSDIVRVQYEDTDGNWVDVQNLTIDQDSYSNPLTTPLSTEATFVHVIQFDKVDTTGVRVEFSSNADASNTTRFNPVEKLAAETFIGETFEVQRGIKFTNTRNNQRMAFDDFGLRGWKDYINEPNAPTFELRHSDAYFRVGYKGYSTKDDSYFEFDPDYNSGVGRAYLKGILEVSGSFSGTDLSSPGLYASGDKLGFYDGSAWDMYFENASGVGKFFISGNQDNGLSWDGSLLSISAQEFFLNAVDGSGVGLTIDSATQSIRTEDGGNSRFEINPNKSLPDLGSELYTDLSSVSFTEADEQTSQYHTYSSTLVNYENMVTEVQISSNSSGGSGIDYAGTITIQARVGTDPWDNLSQVYVEFDLEGESQVTRIMVNDISDYDEFRVRVHHDGIYTSNFDGTWTVDWTVYESTILINNKAIYVRTSDNTVNKLGAGVGGTVISGNVSGVTSIFGRTGDITAQQSDYDSFFVPKSGGEFTGNVEFPTINILQPSSQPTGKGLLVNRSGLASEARLHISGSDYGYFALLDSNSNPAITLRGDAGEVSFFKGKVLLGPASQSPSTLTIQGVSSSTPQLEIQRINNSQQGMRIRAGGAVTRYDSFTENHSAYGRHYFLSTNQNETVTVMELDYNDNRADIFGLDLHVDGDIYMDSALYGSDGKRAFQTINDDRWVAITNTGGRAGVYDYVNSNALIDATQGGKVRIGTDLQVDDNMGIGTSPPGSQGLVIGIPDMTGNVNPMALWMEGVNEVGLRYKTTEGSNRYFQTVYDGSAIEWRYYTGSYDMRMKITNSGNLTVYNDVYAVDFNTTSDRRVKTDLKLFENPLRLFEPINGMYSFLKGGRKQAGLIAQELEASNPLLVNRKRHEDFEEVLTLSAHTIGSLAVAGVKGLIGRTDIMKEDIDENEQEIERLKSRVQTLEKENKKLKQKVA